MPNTILIKFKLGSAIYKIKSKYIKIVNYNCKTTNKLLLLALSKNNLYDMLLTIQLQFNKFIGPSVKAKVTHSPLTIARNEMSARISTTNPVNKVPNKLI